MSELGWLAASDPRKMLGYLGTRASHRKLRLFAVACVRRCPIARFTPEDWSLVKNVESHADGRDKLPDPGPLATKERALLALIRRDPVEAARLTTGETAGVGVWERETGKAEQCQLLRCIFGNPFRPVSFKPEWRTETVVSHAQGMYDSRDFSALTVLASALEDAGCKTADILEHCRDRGMHARGCWVVDLVLEKQ